MSTMCEYSMCEHYAAASTTTTTTTMTITMTIV